MESSAPGARRENARRSRIQARHAHVARRARPGGPAASAPAHEGGRRAPAAQHPEPPAPGRRAHVAAADPHDQRLQLQLPLLSHAARSAHAPGAPQARGARPHLPRRPPAGLGRRAVHHHRHSGPSRPRDGRSHHRPRAPARAAPVRRVYPREAGPRRGAGADRAAHQPGEPGIGQLRGAVRRQPRADRSRKELLNHTGQLRAGARAGASGAGGPRA